MFQWHYHKARKAGAADSDLIGAFVAANVVLPARLPRHPLHLLFFLCLSIFSLQEANFAVLVGVLFYSSFFFLTDIVLVGLVSSA